MVAPLMIHSSCIVTETQGKGRNDDQEADRTQWTSILTLFRSIERLCCLATTPALLLCGWDGTIMVTGHHDESSRLSWSPKSGLGCKMEPDGDIFCHCEQRQDGEAVVNGSYDSIAHICGPSERRRCGFACSPRRFVTEDAGSVWTSTRTHCIWRQDQAIGLPDYGTFNAGRA